MLSLTRKNNLNVQRRLICLVVAIFFFMSTIISSAPVYAQGVFLPEPGIMVMPTSGFQPAVITGISINPQDPLKFDFLINTGDTNIQDQELRLESNKLIKYFLASLTIPEKDMWVNLSPYEQDRIIKNNFGQTQMGRDLLAQDYLLKQLTASLIYPEEQLGQKFWERVYQKVQSQFGTTEIPLNTFNKVWIIPDQAEIYEHNNSAFILNSRLKVMLEEDYLAMQYVTKEEGRKTQDVPGNSQPGTSSISHLTSDVVRDIIIPEIEKEVNEGETFANLRQIYHAMILATWFKLNLKQSLLGQVYVDQSKTNGIQLKDPQEHQRIYEQYLEAFKIGVFDLIKEEYDPVEQTIIPRKYFSGGITTQALTEGLSDMIAASTITDEAMLTALPAQKQAFNISIDNFVVAQRDKAMLVEVALFENLGPGPVAVLDSARRVSVDFDKSKSISSGSLVVKRNFVATKDEVDQMFQNFVSTGNKGIDRFLDSSIIRMMDLIWEHAQLKDIDFQNRNQVKSTLREVLMNSIDGYMQRRDSLEEDGIKFNEDLEIEFSIFQTDQNIFIRLVDNGTAISKSEATIDKEEAVSNGKRRLGSLGVGRESLKDLSLYLNRVVYHMYSDREDQPGTVLEISIKNEPVGINYEQTDQAMLVTHTLLDKRNKYTEPQTSGDKRLATTAYNQLNAMFTQLEQDGDFRTLLSRFRQLPKNLKLKGGHRYFVINRFKDRVLTWQRGHLKQLKAENKELDVPLIAYHGEVLGLFPSVISLLGEYQDLKEKGIHVTAERLSRRYMFQEFDAETNVEKQRNENQRRIEDVFGLVIQPMTMGITDDPIRLEDSQGARWYEEEMLKGFVIDNAKKLRDVMEMETVQRFEDVIEYLVQESGADHEGVLDFLIRSLGNRQAVSNMFRDVRESMSADRRVRLDEPLVLDGHEVWFVRSSNVDSNKFRAHFTRIQNRLREFLKNPENPNYEQSINGVYRLKLSGFWLYFRHLKEEKKVVIVGYGTAAKMKQSESSSTIDQDVRNHLERFSTDEIETFEDFKNREVEKDSKKRIVLRPFLDRAMLSESRTAADQETIDVYTQRVPYLDWSNAAAVYWGELIRSVNDGRRPRSDTQRNYFANQVLVRERMLQLLNDIASGRDITDEEFTQAYKEMHVLLVSGRGDSIYVSNDFAAGGQDAQIANTLGGVFIEDSYGMRFAGYLKSKLTHFLSSEFQQKPIQSRVKEFAVFYDELIHFQNIFAYGNNSYHMQWLNTLLRLTMFEGRGLTGVAHGFWDYFTRDTQAWDQFNAVEGMLEYIYVNNPAIAKDAGSGGATSTEEDRAMTASNGERRELPLVRNSTDERLLRAYKQGVPYLDWANASKVEWRELVRIVSYDPYPESYIQKNYFSNQILVRERMLSLLFDIASGKEITEDDFEEVYREMHKLLVRGTGDSFYLSTRSTAIFPLTEQEQAHARSSAGAFIRPSEAKLFMAYLKERLSEFLSAEFQQQPINVRLTAIAKFYNQLIHTNNVFVYANNSYHMQWVNTLLRLTMFDGEGLQGVEHGGWDMLARTFEIGEKLDATEAMLGHILASNPSIAIDGELEESNFRDTNVTDLAMTAQDTVGLARVNTAIKKLSEELGFYVLPIYENPVEVVRLANLSSDSRVLTVGGATIPFLFLEQAGEVTVVDNNAKQLEHLNKMKASMRSVQASDDYSPADVIRQSDRTDGEKKVLLSNFDVAYDFLRNEDRKAEMVDKFDSLRVRQGDIEGVDLSETQAYDVVYYSTVPYIYFREGDQGKIKKLTDSMVAHLESGARVIFSAFGDPSNNGFDIKDSFLLGFINKHLPGNIKITQQPNNANPIITYYVLSMDKAMLSFAGVRDISIRRNLVRAAIMEDDYDEQLPYLDWSNALEVRWAELVRDQQVDPSPKTQNQKSYFNNQVLVRGQILQLLAELASGIELTQEEFDQRYKAIHVTLTQGNGDSFYSNKDASPETNREKAMRHGGIFENVHISKRFTGELHSKLKRLVSEEFQNLSVADRIDGIVDLIMFMTRQRNVFYYANHSYHMQWANTLLRLTRVDGKGLTGIENGDWDFTLRSYELAYRGDVLSEIKSQIKDYVYFANPQLKKSDPLLAEDRAMLSLDSDSKEVGGIDLDPAMLNLQIKRDASGVPLSIDQQPIFDMQIDGFSPVIINITPVGNVPFLLGLVDENGRPTQLGSLFSLDPVDRKARLNNQEVQELSYLDLR